MIFFRTATFFLLFLEITLLIMLLRNLISKSRILTFQFILQIARFLLNMIILSALRGVHEIPGGNESLIGNLILLSMALMTVIVSFQMVHFSGSLAAEMLDALPVRIMEIEKFYDIGRSDLSEKEQDEKSLNETVKIAGVNNGLSRYVCLESLIYSLFLILIVSTEIRNLYNIHVIIIFFFSGYLIPFGIQLGIMFYLMLRIKEEFPIENDDGGFD